PIGGRARPTHHGPGRATGRRRGHFPATSWPGTSNGRGMSARRVVTSPRISLGVLRRVKEATAVAAPLALPIVWQQSHPSIPPSGMAGVPARHPVGPALPLFRLLVPLLAPPMSSLAPPSFPRAPALDPAAAGAADLVIAAWGAHEHDARGIAPGSTLTRRHPI